MAVSATNLTAGGDNTLGGVASYTTASISPSANALVLLSVTKAVSTSTEPTTPTVSGNGLTWVLVNASYYDNSSSSRRKIFLFRAMGASPSAGAVTVTNGENAYGGWTIDEFTGVDTSGTNGSGAIVQSAVNQVTDNSASTLTITLSAFGNVNNATFSNFSEADTAHSITPGTGFTQLAETSVGTVNFSQWKSSNDTSVDITSSDVFIGGGVAVEIKAAVTTAVKDLIMSGIIAFPR